ncbi:O-antigen ligase family protein [Hoeflea poritis]|uniref:O-antigen ligase family protein n=1 Tax=Hoeflea poritis TaxID=2993659 RepID=A0ABT4VQ71_9HYPH|nr:O-antigen ligase family protein [Hoeflea poritis]MDA4846860.1 O-antigen ligase family protein [Hoeflea poritis]
MSDAALDTRTDPAALAVIAKFSLALGAFLSGFVIYEPAPYEIYMVALIAIWFIFGLRLSRNGAILLAILMCFNIGGLISLTVLDELTPKLKLYMAVSVFLALSSVFFAAVIEADGKRLKVIFSAYLIGALLTGMLGILGYFQLLPNSELFLRYGRAKGAFQDPNVFGPFLVLPACFLMHQVLKGGFAASIPRIVALVVLTLAVFLAFSRAAWGLFAFSMLAMVFLMLLKERSNVFRMRILFLGAFGFVSLAAVLMIALQFEQVSELFTTRAQLIQEYDSGQFGRFNRYRLGLGVALLHPFGIGPLEFGKMFGEDTHNIWLKALLDYGWLGFIAYLTLIVWTLGAGFKCLLRDRPWQPYFLCAYVVFVGHILISTFIDTDHWRHFYILLGILWGCMGLEYQYMRRHRLGSS